MARTVKTPIDRHGEFVKLLLNISDENAVRNAYRIVMGIKDWEAPFACDGYYDNVLYEFKCARKLGGKEGSKALAQSCYYLRKFINEPGWFDKSGQRHLTFVPIKVAVADENEAFVVMTSDLEEFFKSDKYDWSRTASSPDENLITDIKNSIKPIVFKIQEKNSFQSYLDTLEAAGTTVLKVINRNNFDKIFEVWQQEFVNKENSDPQRNALAYLLDLNKKGICDPQSGTVLFDFEGETKNLKLRVPVDAYNRFWSTYKRPPTAKELSAIYERKDRLVAMQNRRMDGEFFTPLPYAKLAHEYLAKAIPDAYEGTGNHHSMYDEYNWYDPCCGTGNLTYHCPTGMKGKLFMSTLNQEDVDVCQGSGQNPNAQIFKYDFLNQTDEELPVELRERLTPGSKWVFVFNPPFFAGNDLRGMAKNDGYDRKDNTQTIVSSNMKDNGIGGQPSKNLYAQFLYKVGKIVRKYNIDAKIGIFSVSAYLNGTGYKNFRSKWLKYFSTDGGFIFSNKEFQGTKGSWAISYVVWSNTTNKTDIILDVYNNQEKIGTKQFGGAELPLSEWVNRPKATIISPVLNGAISCVNANNKTIYAEKITPDALGYFLCVSNDVQNSASFCGIFSSKYNTTNGWSITSDNFEKTNIALFARKIIPNTWSNNRDEYSVPNTSHPEYEQFKNDAIVWALFNGSNQSSSLGEVEYKDTIYDIKNEFFWLTKEEFGQIEQMPHNIVNQSNKNNERFVSEWLKDKSFSPDVRELLELGKELVRVSAWARPHADPKFQLMRWDAGWYQIRMGLFGKDVRFPKTDEMIDTMERFTEKYKEVTVRLRPYVYELGFLPKEIMFEEESQIC